MAQFSSSQKTRLFSVGKGRYERWQHWSRRDAKCEKQTSQIPGVNYIYQTCHLRSILDPLHFKFFLIKLTHFMMKCRKPLCSCLGYHKITVQMSCIYYYSYSQQICCNQYLSGLWTMLCSSSNTQSSQPITFPVILTHSPQE